MMFSRALLVALCIVYATSLAPISAPADDDCALYLTGPGRSSAYDYSLNLLKGNFLAQAPSVAVITGEAPGEKKQDYDAAFSGKSAQDCENYCAYDGQHTCVTYEAINQAYHDARNRILVSQPKGDWKAEDFASVGELILDISINLARTYGLTYEEIEKGLPLIDTSRTLIREVCPPVFSHVECRAGKYRRFDGLCNNLRHPTWGATMAPFQRLIGPLFSDGINAPRISHTGHDLPLSRVVSRTMHPDDGFHDHAGTVMVIAWGQFMDHDYTLTGTPLDPIHRNDPEECCKRPPHLKHPYCNEIRVPDDDYFYRLFGVKCIDFVRGFPSPRPGCRLGSRVPFNTLTGAIDGNTVYGVTEKFARKLRTGYGGLLRMNPVFKEYGLKDLLPLKLDIPDEGCTRPNKNMYCFEAGEIRVNEQLVLTVMHTLMAREHNRVAEGLAAVNPHWDDESLFQEARRINIAEIQHITFNEFLPILLGKDVMEKFGLVLAKEGYWDGYDPEVNPDVIASFASAAYRFGHSLLPTAVERWSKAHKFIASKRLSDLIRRPYDLYRAGVLDEYVMGLMNQVAQAMDDSITQEVTNHLFKKVGARFGMDLVSFNMQRGREFGIPGYMEFRKFCGLSGADTFQDLFGSMANETIRKYETIFEHPVDVDLWSGGVSERPLSGSMLGPTFACIIATQFSYSRRGDRFWFELPNQPSSFTPEQLVEIRKSRLARVICDNTDIIDTVQLYPMVLPDHELNPRVPCRSGVIPSMDFSKWADPVPFLGGSKEYMTGANIYNMTTNQNNVIGKECDNLDNETSGCYNMSTISQNISNDTVPVTLTVKNGEKNIELCKFDNNNTDCLKENNKNNCNLNKNCTTEISNQNNEKIIPVEGNNTLLKYITKKSDNIKVLEKSKGHIKNSLKRRKRSLRGNDENRRKLLLHEDFNDNDKVIAPINKYQNKEGKDLDSQNYDSDGIIKTSNLANFQVETLHKNNNPHHSKPRKSNQRYYSPINNNPYGSQARESQDTNNKNISYDVEKYDELENDQNIPNSDKRPNAAHRKRKQEYHDDINNKAYLSNKERLNENDSERDIENRSLQEDDNYNDEILIKKVKPSNNILQKGSLRYHKDRKNKYHISRPNLQSKNVGSDSRKNIHKARTSTENDSSEDDEEEELPEKERFHHNRKQSKKQRQKQKYHDHKKSIDEDNLSNQEENDEDDSHENYKNGENFHTQPNNIVRGQNEGYNNEKYNDYREPSYRDQKNTEKYEGEDAEKGNEYENDEDDHDDDEDNEDFKHSGISEYQQTPYSVLQQQNQKYYNDIKNKLRLPESKRFGEKICENYDGKDLVKLKEYNNSEEDEVSVESLNRDGLSNQNRKGHASINNFQKLNQVYHNDKNNKYLSSKTEQFEEDNPEHLKKEDTDENKKYVKDGEALTPKLKTDQSFHTNDNDASLQSARITNIKAKNDNISERTEEFANDNKSIKNNDNLNFLNTPATKNRNRYLLNDDRSKYGSYSNLKSNSNEESNKIKEKASESLEDNYKNNPTLSEAPSKSEDIQKADLSDFSYERFKGSNEEKIEPFKSLQQNYESDTLPKTVSTIVPNIDEKYYNINKTDINKKPKEFERQTQNNDDVVKPIIELNEKNSNKEKENGPTVNLKSNFRDFLPNTVNYIEKDSNLKLKPNLNLNENVNVKQQFERIPLNYNHADNNITVNALSTIDDKSGVDARPKDKNNLDENLNFKFTPEANVYDENLKIKFGDINIKLPEIKLPEDVLIYAQEDESIENKSQPDYYNYDSEKVEQGSEKPKIKDNVQNNYVSKAESINSEKPISKADGDYDFFASYINKPHDTNLDVAKDNKENENSEDLYEKFVRERFGRKNSFKERSEKLQEKKIPVNRPKNQELFETLQKAIKKAEEVQKEAHNSGDPDASYLWTLEYGEKL